MNSTFFLVASLGHIIFQLLSRRAALLWGGLESISLHSEKSAPALHLSESLTTALNLFLELSRGWIRQGRGEAASRKQETVHCFGSKLYREPAEIQKWQACCRCFFLAASTVLIITAGAFVVLTLTVLLRNPSTHLKPIKLCNGVVVTP